MRKKFFQRFRRAKTFDEWLNRMKAFDYQLIIGMGLQSWTLQDFKNYWNYYKGDNV